MRLVIVYFGPFNVNSAIQAFHFARDLTDVGWTVTLRGGGRPGSGSARWASRTSSASRTATSPIVLERCRRADEPTIVLAWTPRENVRHATEDFCPPRSAPHTSIHLEDNEWYLYGEAVRRPIEQARRLTLAEQDRITPPTLIHPTRSETFMAGAAGITVITEELNEFNHAGRPHHVARPGIDSERFRPDLEPPLGRRDARDRARRVRARLPRHRPLRQPARDAEPLPRVKLLQRRGRKVALGPPRRDRPRRRRPALVRALCASGVHRARLGGLARDPRLPRARRRVRPARRPPTTSTATGCPRSCPSSSPWAARSCCRTATSATTSSDGQDALLLERGDALEIAERLEQLIADRELRERLSAGARRFALEHLDWKDNSIALGRFLNRIETERSPGARARAAGGVAMASRALESARRAKAAARRRLKARLAPRGPGSPSGQQRVRRGHRRRRPVAAPRPLSGQVRARGDRLRHRARLRRLDREPARARGRERAT